MSAALPPLPLPDKQSCEDDPMYGIMPVYHYTADQMQTYAQQARADLEAENKRLRGLLEIPPEESERVMTVVYRNPTRDEVQSFMDHPKAVWFGWCHAPHQRDAARAALKEQQ